MSTQQPSGARRSVLTAASLALWVVAIGAPLLPAPVHAAGVALVRTGAYNNSLNVSALTVTIASTTAGDLLVMQGSLTNTAGTFTNGAGWTQAVAASQTNNGRVELWYYPNNPGGITSASFGTGSTTDVEGQLTEWSGVQTAAPLDQIGNASNAGFSSLTVGTAAATGAAGELAVTMYTINASTTPVFTPGAGWTNVTNKPALSVVADYLVTGAAGVISENEGFGANEPHAVGIIATFKPAASGPAVTSISPTSGPALGGTSVQISGTGFTGTGGAAGVRFGATDATSYVVNTNVLITAVSPAAAAGTVDITVTNGSTSTTSAADQFAYIGSLTLGAPASIAFPATALVGTSDQTVTQTSAFTVIDTTTGVGWKLQATGGLLSSGAHTLGASTIPSAPSWACNGGCTLPANAIGYPYSVPTGAATTMYDAASGTGRQSMTGTFSFDVRIPANSYAGNYSAVWTFTIFSGP